MMKHTTMSVIKPAIKMSMARVLLERNVPSYISITDVDESICKVNADLNDLTPRFRKSQITQTIPVVSYVRHSVSGRGKISFRLNGDHDSVKTKLEQIAGEEREDQIHQYLPLS